jgi:hypothetical protein
MPSLVREGRSRASGCQALGCTAAAVEVVEVQLPAAWEANERYSVLPVAIGACGEHAPELWRRATALLAARADLHALLVIADDAAPAEQELRGRADVAEALLGLATDRARYAEAALCLLEEELLPPGHTGLVQTARTATGVDRVALLERELESELAAGASADVALERVRQRAADALRQQRARLRGRS